MLPLGSTSSVTSLVVPVNGAYSFINYAAGQWYMTSSNNLANAVGTLTAASPIFTGTITATGTTIVTQAAGSFSTNDDEIMTIMGAWL